MLRYAVVALAFVLGTINCFAAVKLASELKQQFQLGWNTSPRAVLAAKKHFESLKQLGPLDNRLSYAHALVLMKHRRYEEASQLLDELLTADPANLPMRQAKIWNLMIRKDYAGAGAEMQILSRALPKQAADPEAERSAREQAAFLGRMFGFLEGPAAGALTASLPKGVKQDVIAAIGAGRADAFQEAYQQTQAQAKKLALERDRIRADAKASHEAARQQELERLDRLKQARKEEEAAIQNGRKRLDEQLAPRLAEANRLLAPAESRRRQLESEIQSLETEATSTLAERDRLNRLAGEEEDEQTAARYRDDADDLQTSLDRIDGRIRDAQNAIIDIRNQNVALYASRDAIQAQLISSTNELNRRAAVLLATARQVMIDEKRATRPAKRTSAKSISVSAAAAAFGTYEDFPFDSERDRLLESVGEPKAKAAPGQR